MSHDPQSPSDAADHDDALADAPIRLDGLYLEPRSARQAYSLHQLGLCGGEFADFAEPEGDE